ncbi:hypothetical protein FRC01_008718 [Tulasnella sp. 417]|nr:hypothetical protein FRC01_008718 [Tulasnella sp. 417]
MAKDPTPGPADRPDPYTKAREILNGLPTNRIDSRRIKTTDNRSGVTGGHATVVVGTLIPPEEVRTWMPAQFLKYLFKAKYAVKKLRWDREDADESEKFFKLFVNELSIMAQLSHDNIVQLAGFVEDMKKGDAWIVLPWEANGNVREFLQSGEWDIPERISLIQDVVAGVEYLHTRQPPICHGDLKSLNILVNSSYHAVITDFGSARKKASADVVEHDASEGPCRASNAEVKKDSKSPRVKLNPSTLELTLTGPGFSLRWTAPEVLKEEVPDLPSDVWAVGKITRNPRALGMVLRDGRQDEQAQSLFSQALSAYNRAGSCVKQAGALLYLATTYVTGHKHLQAEESLNQALTILIQLNDDRLQEPALELLAWIFRDQCSYSATLAAPLQTGAAVYEGMGDRILRAAALHNLGKTFLLQKKYGQAEDSYSSALAIFSSAGDARGEASALRSLGTLYTLQRRLDLAKERFTQARSTSVSISDHEGELMALGCLMGACLLQSKRAGLRSYCVEALKIHHRAHRSTSRVSPASSSGVSSAFANNAV